MWLFVLIYTKAALLLGRKVTWHNWYLICFGLLKCFIRVVLNPRLSALSAAFFKYLIAALLR